MTKRDIIQEYKTELQTQELLSLLKDRNLPSSVSEITSILAQENSSVTSNDLFDFFDSNSTSDLELYEHYNKQEFHEELENFFKSTNVNFQKNVKVSEVIDNINPTYKHEYLKKYDRTNSPKRDEYQRKFKDIYDSSTYDFWFPELNVAVNLNLTYSSSHYKREPYHHNMLHNFSRDNGLHLIQIHQTQWEEKTNICKERLKSKLNFQQQRYYARECDVQYVNSNTARQFCEKHHIQGFTQAKHHLMLYRNCVPLAYMSFNVPRSAMSQSGYDFELIRYCSSGIVVGGASKLFKTFIRDYNPTAIRSFSDNDWNNGELYRNLGFKFEGLIGQGYWYIKDNKMSHRYNFTKQSLVSKGFSDDLTEFQIMDARGYFRYYDSGNSKWMWNK